jgi:dienelactone hydrolase
LNREGQQRELFERTFAQPSRVRYGRLCASSAAEFAVKAAMRRPVRTPFDFRQRQRLREDEPCLGSVDHPMTYQRGGGHMSTLSTEAKPRSVNIGQRRLEGEVALPRKAKGLIIFAHGSGSSRYSPRNTHMARRFQAQGLGTLLLDLLTEHEDYDRRKVFDISLLGGRVVEAVRYARSDTELSRLPIGLFGASTGAGAALVAAAQLPAEIAAVVSRGGRPDLAGTALKQVCAATLLIVGGADYGVIELNRDAFEMLTCKKKLETVPGATHLFDEPGTLDTVVELAAQWFNAHLEATTR